LSLRGAKRRGNLIKKLIKAIRMRKIA
jgi:hypothetical protein